MSYCYDYPRPMVTVDIMVFHPAWGNPEELLLIQRKQPPFEGKWAFPGGFCNMDETLETAAMRELKEETNAVVSDLKQFKTISTIDRDPRGRTITTVFFHQVDKEEISIRAADDAHDARWFPISELPPLAFDHDEILRQFLQETKDR